MFGLPNSKFEYRSTKQIRIPNDQNFKQVLNIRIYNFEIVSYFACLREAVSAKAGISYFGFQGLDDAIHS